MNFRTRMKVFLITVIGVVSLAIVSIGLLVLAVSGSAWPNGVPFFVAGLALFGLFGTPFWISIYSDIEAQKRYEKSQIASKREIEIQRSSKLRREIVSIVAHNPMPLSVYDFMTGIQDSEELIEFELESFVAKGLATRMINESGLKLYAFQLIPLETERKDLLDENG